MKRNVWLHALLALLSSLVPTGNGNSESIPIINLQAWTDPTEFSNADRSAVADQVRQACQHIGFFAVQHHNVDAHVMSAAWNATRAFFDLPLDIKLQAKTSDEATYPYGYENSERLIRGKHIDINVADAADMKETFSIGPSNPASGMPPRRWPTREASELERALSSYYVAMEKLSMLLLQIFAATLNLPRDFFEGRMNHHMSALRILNYFVPATANSSTVRASEHTDYGVLTILWSGGPGLQVKKDTVGANDDAWLDVPQLANTFIINLGDLMQRWTNDGWVSTLHRVTTMSNQNIQRRQSIAYFVNLNGDCIVDPRDLVDTSNATTGGGIKYPPITMKEHLMAKHLKSMGLESVATREGEL